MVSEKVSVLTIEKRRGVNTIWFCKAKEDFKLTFRAFEVAFEKTFNKYVNGLELTKTSDIVTRFFTLADIHN